MQTLYPWFGETQARHLEIALELLLRVFLCYPEMEAFFFPPPRMQQKNWDWGT